MNLTQEQVGVLRKQRILLVGSYPKNPFPLWKGMSQASHSLPKIGARVLYMSLDDLATSIPRIRNFAPTVSIVVTTNHTMMVKLMHAFKKIPGRRGLWHNDLRPAPAILKALNGVFNTFFMCWNERTGPYALDLWQKYVGSEMAYMPQGSLIYPFEPQMHRETKRAIFIGDVKDPKYHSGRREFIEAIGAEILNANLRKKRVKIEGASKAHYRSSRYCPVHSPTVTGYNSLRLYNVLAYGGLALVWWFPDIERLFTHKRHVLICKNLEEVRAICNEYDNKPKERAKIRENGHNLQQQKHTISMRVANMAYALATEDSTFWGYL